MALENKDKGLRFNEGKTRHDLLPIFAVEQMARVFTKGAEKYAENNWRLGMQWTKVVASLKRHLSAFEMGEDFDKETGLLHMAHVMTNAAFLCEYYKIYPEGDNRRNVFLGAPKVALDIDDVLAGFVAGFCERFNVPTPEEWLFDYDISSKIDEIKDDKDFWMSIKPKVDPKDIPFTPHCYITARVIPTEWTMEWLQANGFPTAKVITLKKGQKKSDVALSEGVSIFVDDSYEHFVDINNVGIACYLFDTPHNRKYNVGYRRIKELKEITDYMSINNHNGTDVASKDVNPNVANIPNVRYIVV